LNPLRFKNIEKRCYFLSLILIFLAKLEAWKESGISGGILVASEDDFLHLEFTPKKLFTINPEKDRIVRTNHYLSDPKNNSALNQEGIHLFYFYCVLKKTCRSFIRKFCCQIEARRSASKSKII